MEDASKTALLIGSDIKIKFEGLDIALCDFNMIFVSEQIEARDLFVLNEIDVVLLDHDGDQKSTDLLRFFKSIKPSVPVIVTTDQGSESLAITVFRSGAWDYFNNPLDADCLNESVNTVLDLKKGRAKKKVYKGLDGLDRAISYINDNYKSNLTLTRVAREAGMSTSHFERVFKARMDMTFVSYVNDLRIIMAKDLLGHESFSMSEIAFACGFTNQYHFTRTFKKIAKQTPSSFRKSLKKKIQGPAVK